MLQYNNIVLILINVTILYNNWLFSIHYKNYQYNKSIMIYYLLILMIFFSDINNYFVQQYCDLFAVSLYSIHFY